MRRGLVVLSAIMVTLFALTPTSQAYEAGRRYGAFTYPNYPGISMSLSAWFNVDTVNDKTRGYGYTNPPDYAGFRSSALSEMRAFDYHVTTTISGNRIYGFTEQLTSSTYLLICNNVTSDYWSTEHWQTTDADDYNYQGAFDSYVVNLAPNCG